MANPVLQSHTSAGHSSGDPTTFTVNMPTGVTAGDLLMLFYHGDRDLSTLSGWTVLNNHTGNPGLSSYVRTLYKIADSSDAVAATISLSTNEFTYATVVVARITGFHTTATFPFNVIQSATNNSGVYSLSGLNLLPHKSDCLLLGVISFEISSLSAAGGTSAETINGTNPSWTEVFSGHGSSSNSQHITVASANLSTSNTITSFSTTCTSVGNIGVYEQLIAIASAGDINVTVTTSTLSLLSTLQNPSTSVGVDVTPDTVSLTTEVEQPKVKTNSNNWDNETRNTTTWTNQTK